jgi:hypothetical protein
MVPPIILLIAIIKLITVVLIGSSVTLFAFYPPASWRPTPGLTNSGMPLENFR